MSSSSRNLSALTGAPRSRFVWGLLVLLAAPTSWAQQVMFTPRVEATAMWDSNQILSANHPQSGEWYQALFAGDWQRITQRSDFEIRPQVTLQDSSIKTLDQYEALLNIRGNYRTQRSAYSLVAEYHRQDAYNSEYGLAGFNPLNPDAPNTVGSGTIVTGITRESYQLSPSLTHSFTERLNGEIDTSFIAVRYSTQIPQELVSFSSTSAVMNAVWVLSQRTQLAAGPFYSQYDPTDGFLEGALKTKSYGVSFSYRYLTTKLTNSAISLKLGRDDQDQFDGSRTVANTWGLEWKGTYNWQTSRIQFTVGRDLEPSGVGGEVALYQIRAQYFYSFSPTLIAQIAARAGRETGIGSETLGGNRDRGYGDASLMKLLSRDWFVTGGYRFLYQKTPPSNVAVNNNGVYLTVGYHPIEPR